MRIHSHDELKGILSNFSLPEKEYQFQQIAVGYINDTYLISIDARPLFILQRINHDIFKNVEVIMMNINRALKQLRAVDYKQIKIIPATSGKTYISLPSGYWRIMSYIPNSITFNTTNDTQIAEQAGRIIGKFHLLLATEDSSKYVETIPKFHNLELRKMQFLAALAKASDEKKEIASETIKLTHKLLHQLEDIRPSKVPLRICHNDTKLNNILFSKTKMEALCLIDLDTIMPGYFHFDFGDAVRTIVNTAPEDEKNCTKITFDKTLFESFVKGIASNQPFLRKEEIKALPYGVVLMPFLHGLRALTDYLNGNIYYKVSYENQNLDRCQSLFAFSMKAQNNFDYMKNKVLNMLKE